MNLLTEWVKPSGTRIELNDEEATVDQARKLGWIPFAETPEGLAEAEAILAERERRAEATVAAANKDKPADIPKRGRPKAQKEADAA